jgi:uncharacterized protein (UPF0335 family)
MAANRSDEALRGYVERVVGIEREYLDAKAERGDLIKDMKAEVKSNHDSTGVDWKEVERLSKIRLEEQAAREKCAELEGDLETFEGLFGAPAPDSEDPDDV